MSPMAKQRTPVEQVLDRLEHVRPGSNGWTALCPAHDDSRASLSVAEGGDGRVLIHCFAGCGIEEILAVLDLEMFDLFPHPRTTLRRKGTTR
jgi:hypothetical protein